MKEKSGSGMVKRILNNPVSGPYIALIILLVIASIISPIFPTFKNITNILRQASIVGVVSIGMTMVLLVGGIDLSVTSTMAIAACVMARMMEPYVAAGGTGIYIGPILLVLFFGFVIGLVNGSIIVCRGVEAFIITLGTGQVLKGLIPTERREVRFPNSGPPLVPSPWGESFLTRWSFMQSSWSYS